MEALLNTASDPIWVSIIFVVILIALHGWLVVWKPLDMQQWKLVEYVWVSLAVVSTLGLVDEARRYKAELDADVNFTRIERDINSIENWFSVYRIFACEEQADNLEYKGLCDWVTIKDADLKLILEDEEAIAPDIRLNILNGIGNDNVRLTASEVEIISGLVIDYGQSKSAYIDNVEISKASKVQRFLISLAPILFAIALALKMTKVTGEYRCYKRRKQNS